MNFADLSKECYQTVQWKELQQDLYGVNEALSRRQMILVIPAIWSMN